MFYIVKFVKSNSVGIIRKEWMVDSKTTKYPPRKHLKKYLIDNTCSYKSSWDSFQCILKYPKEFGAEGIEDLSDAYEKEKFFVDFTDTEEYESFQKKKIYDKMHPVQKYANQLDLNKLVLSKHKVHILIKSILFNVFNMHDLFRLYQHLKMGMRA